MKLSIGVIVLSLVAVIANAGTEFPGIPQNAQVNESAVVVCDGLTGTSWTHQDRKLEYRPMHVEVLKADEGKNNFVADVFVAGKRIRQVNLILQKDDSRFVLANPSNNEFLSIGLRNAFDSQKNCLGATILSTLINDGNRNPHNVNCRVAGSFLKMLK